MGFRCRSDDDDFEEEILETNTGFGNVIVVDNLPVVAPEKYEKLEGVIRKIFGQIGVIREMGLWMPREGDGDGKTKGYAFIEYTTPQEAQTAREQTNGYKLDKAHVFAVNMFDDFDKYMRVPDTWVPPESKPYTPGVSDASHQSVSLSLSLSLRYSSFPKRGPAELNLGFWSGIPICMFGIVYRCCTEINYEGLGLAESFSLAIWLSFAAFFLQENMLAWLTDDRGRDQFVIRFGSDTEVYWNDHRQGKPDPVYQRQVRVGWFSGVCLWSWFRVGARGGDAFDKIIARTVFLLL